MASVVCEGHIESRSSSWKHPWVCISESGWVDDEPAIWVWVNETLLNSSKEALVFDCLVMPVGRMRDAVSAQLGAAVEVDKIRSDGAGTIYFEVTVLILALRIKVVEKSLGENTGCDVYEVCVVRAQLDVVCTTFHFQPRYRLYQIPTSCSKRTFASSKFADCFPTQ